MSGRTCVLEALPCFLECILDACADTIETEDLSKALKLRDCLDEYLSMPETVADFSLREAAETVLKKFNL